MEDRKGGPICQGLQAPKTSASCARFGGITQGLPETKQDTGTEPNTARLPLPGTSRLQHACKLEPNTILRWCLQELRKHSHLSHPDCPPRRAHLAESSLVLAAVCLHRNTSQTLRQTKAAKNKLCEHSTPQPPDTATPGATTTPETLGNSHQTTSLSPANLVETRKKPKKALTETIRKRHETFRNGPLQNPQKPLSKPSKETFRKPKKLFRMPTNLQKPQKTLKKPKETLRKPSGNPQETLKNLQEPQHSP